MERSVPCRVLDEEMTWRELGRATPTATIGGARPGTPA